MKFSILLLIVSALAWWPVLWHSVYSINNSPTTWKSYTKRWLADRLMGLKEADFVRSNNGLFSRTQEIWRVCFSKRHLTDQCGGHVQGLCNRVKWEITTSDPCQWMVEVPIDLCVAIKILNLPPNDPYVKEGFQLRIKGLSTNHNNESLEGIRINKNIHNLIVFTNSSLVKIDFVVSKYIASNKIQFCHQATQCNTVISTDTFTFHKEKPLKFPNNRPYSIHPQSKVTEYHVLLRTNIQNLLRIYARCGIFKLALRVYDGPSLLKTHRKVKCSKNALVRLTASTFQFYLVFRHRHDKRGTLITYSSFYDKNTIETLLLSDEIDSQFSWNFNNFSSIKYQKYYFKTTKYKNFRFSILVEPSEGSFQGHMCQYGGLLVQIGPPHHSRLLNKIGPICTKEYALLLNNITVPTKYGKDGVLVVLYQYGLSYSQTGKIIFIMPKYLKPCFEFINFCNFCEIASKSFIYMVYLPKVNDFQVQCKDRQTIVWLKNSCLELIVVQNEEMSKIHQCTIVLQTTAFKNMEFQLHHRYVSTVSSSSCEHMTSPPFRNYKVQRKDKLTSFQSSVSHTFFMMSLNISWNLCPMISLIYVRADVISNNCQDAVVRPGSITDAPYEFAGSCFKFSIAFTSYKTYSFKVYLSNQVENLKQFLNNFHVLSYFDDVTKYP